MKRFGDYSSIAVAIISIIFGAGALYNTIKNQEPRICKIEEKVQKMEVMANDITWIKDYMQRKLK